MIRSPTYIHVRIAVSITTALLFGSMPPAAPSQAQAPASVKTQAAGEVIPEGFVLNTLAGGFSNPTAFAFFPKDAPGFGGGMLVATQAGFLHLFQNGQLRSPAFLDLSAEVSAANERGLMDVAIDPDFARNGFIYALYTYDQPGEEADGFDLRLGKLVRFKITAGRVVPESATVLLDGYESDVPFHAPGSIRFDRAGHLFVSFGDSSNPYELNTLALRAQNLDKLQGKIIRINRDGSAPSDNPFFDRDNPGSIRSKIWAYGFRNPFRFSLHPESQTLYAGNIGLVTHESIVRALRGGNFGWPCFESRAKVPDFAQRPECARITRADLIETDFDYQHEGNNAAIVGGDFSGDAFPENMRGDFFYGDFSQRVIRRAVIGVNGRVIRTTPFASGIGFPVDIKFGPDGALYLADYIGGRIMRITYRPDLHKPVADLQITAITPHAVAGNSANHPAIDSVASAAGIVITASLPISLTFSAAQSSDEDGGLLRFTWDFNAVAGSTVPDTRSGSASSQLIATDAATVTRAFARPGSYLVRLAAIDNNGWSSTAERRVDIRDTRPTPVIVTPAHGDLLRAGTRVRVTGRASSSDAQDLPPDRMSWTVERLDGTRALIASGSGTAMTFTMPSASPNTYGPQLDEYFAVSIRLTVSDTLNQVNSTQTLIYPAARDGYIRAWWLLGSFPGRTIFDDTIPGGDAAFAQAQAPDFDRLGARQIYSPQRKIDLSAFAAPAADTVAYLFVWIDSPGARDALLGINSDDGIAVLLNGEQVWRNRVNRFVQDDTRDYDLPAIRLKKGANTLLIKVDQGSGEWAFKLRVLNPNGSVMRDAQLRMRAPEGEQ